VNRTTLGEFAERPSYYARWIFLHCVTLNAPEVLESLSEVAEGDKALEDWASEHGFADPWLLEIARATREAIQRYPELPKDWHGRGVVEHQPEYPLPPWEPRWETAKAFRRRINAYIKHVSQRELASGVVRIPELRNGQHFEWLVLYHVKGKTLEEVAQECQSEKGLDVSTVGRAVTKLAGLIGLTLRARRRAWTSGGT
jgi:hypothetical protein